MQEEVINLILSVTTPSDPDVVVSIEFKGWHRIDGYVSCTEAERRFGLVSTEIPTDGCYP